MGFTLEHRQNICENERGADHFMALADEDFDGVLFVEDGFPLINGHRLILEAWLHGIPINQEVNLVICQ